MMPRRDDSLDSLLPAMHRATISLVAKLQQARYRPLVWETGRSAAREAVLDAKGAGSKGISMHRYGAAVDILCKDHMWDCHKHGCKFYEAMAFEAKAMGLESGHYWKRVDSVHVQAVPLRMQTLFRQLKTELERDAFIRPFLKLPDDMG